MLDISQLNKYLNADDFAQAYELVLKHSETLKNNPIIDNKSGTTVLHVLAASPELNDAIEKNEKAQLLINFALSSNCISSQNRDEKKTALHIALEQDNRNTAMKIFHYARENLPNPDFIKSLMTTDKNKRIPLHYAVLSCNNKMVQKIIDQDAPGYNMFFTKDKDTLFSLAMALDQYRKNPSELGIAMMNQLYFSLPRGRLRTKVAEENVYMGWGWYSTALWRYALRYCVKRDAEGTITETDYNLVDFIHQVIKDGITVMGYYVDLPLVYGYSESYSDTPGEMLQKAIGTMDKALAKRTIGQITQNTTLAKKQEFARRAKLATSDFWLKSSTEVPKNVRTLTDLSQNKDFIVKYDNELYFIPSVPADSPAEKRPCLLIDPENLSEGRKKYYNNLKDKLSGWAENKSQKAESESIKWLIHIIPLNPDTPRAPQKSSNFTCLSKGTSIFALYNSVPGAAESDSVPKMHL